VTFNSLQFVALFAIVLLLYYRFGVNGQNRLMLVAGSVFYAAFDWRFLGLLYLSAVVDFLVGRGIEDSTSERRRRGLLMLSLVVQIGILVVFKYFDFFASSFTTVLGWIGLTASPITLEVLLPVGVSFYTFQTLAYVITVYRRQMPAERNLITFAAFVAWFPQLVAGPIERPTSLLPQIQRTRMYPDRPVVESALVLIVTGLFKKVVIADGVAKFVNDVYAAPSGHGWTTLSLATLGFAVQVYGDFSGYSDIARGVSRLLGVELRRNFEEPFLSRDMREFWQRWHTSLGWWFTEFVGRPLGGAGRGPARAVFNVLVIFTLIGLWHGASWTFVVWGAYNGVLVAIWRFIEPPSDRHPMRLRLRDVPAVVRTFLLFCVGVVFFRSASFGDAVTVFGRIASFADGTAPAPVGGGLVLLFAGIVVAVDLWARHRRIEGIERTGTRARLGTIANRPQAAVESLTYDLSPATAGAVSGLLLCGIVLFSGGVPTPFIYFQF
jgi:D-alanyl-lipoteichoic acid acyltransferase DltB (MBOAT superfamily)